MFRLLQLFGVLSVKALGLDADLTPSTERTVCGFVGLTLLFRGLVRLCWYLDLDLLKSVFILTMDVLMNCLLSFMILLCLAQGSFPLLCAFHGKTDSSDVVALSPFIVNIDSMTCASNTWAPLSYTISSPGLVTTICCTCSIHLLSLMIFPFPSGVNTIHRAVAAASVHRQNCACCVSDFKIDVHGTVCSVGERNITHDTVMFQ